MTSSARPPVQFMVEEVSPSYWRVTFENGPVNLVDAGSVEQLAHLVDRIEDSPALTVVVFDSANPEYFMAHWDLKADKARVAAMAPGPTGMPPYLDNLVRLSKVPAITICATRGRARGGGGDPPRRRRHPRRARRTVRVRQSHAAGRRAGPVRRRIRAADRRIRQ